MFTKLFAYFSRTNTEKLAKRNHNRYTKWLAAHAPIYATGQIDLKRVFTTDSGVNFYLPSDMLTLTMERKAKIEEAQAAFDYGMSAPEMLTTLRAILTAVEELPFDFSNKDKVKKFVALSSSSLRDAIYRIEFIKTEKVILEIALLIFHIEGEDPYKLNELTQKRKRDIAITDDALRGFFLTTIIVLLKESQKTD